MRFTVQPIVVGLPDRPGVNFEHEQYEAPKQKRQPACVGVLLLLFLVARGGIEPTTQRFSAGSPWAPIADEASFYCASRAHQQQENLPLAN